MTAVCRPRLRAWRGLILVLMTFGALLRFAPVPTAHAVATDVTAGANANNGYNTDDPHA
jgi:hypothetical protein